MKLIFATHNEGKLKEFAELLSGLEVDVVSADEAGVAEEIVEDGKTFEENANIKAKYVAAKTHQWAIADDTGLCVDALNGEPGVYSARWVGKEASQEQIRDALLKRMEPISDEMRRAYFETVVSLCHPSGEYRNFSGKLFGSITREPRGKIRKHLVYDQVFVPDGYTKTFAEMTDTEKNAISHRSIAFKEAKTFIQNQILKQST